MYGNIKPGADVVKTSGRLLFQPSRLPFHCELSNRKTLPTTSYLTRRTQTCFCMSYSTTSLCTTCRYLHTEETDTSQTGTFGIVSSSHFFRETDSISMTAHEQMHQPLIPGHFSCGLLALGAAKNNNSNILSFSSLSRLFKTTVLLSQSNEANAWKPITP